MSSTSKAAILGAIPVLIYSVVVALNRFGIPGASGTTPYLWLQAWLLAPLLAGAAVGLRRGAPLWCYSWMMFAVFTIPQVAWGIASGYSYQRGTDMALLGIGQLAAVVAALGIAAVLGRRGVKHGVFAFMLALLYMTLPFPLVRESSPYISAATANALTPLFAGLAAAEAATAAFVIVQFVRSQAEARNSLYILAAVIFFDPLMQAWATGLKVPANPVVAGVSLAFTTWVIWGVSLLAAWGFSWLATRTRAA